MYNPTLPKFLRSSRDVVDFVEVIPDMFWTDNGESHQPRFAELDSWTSILRSLASDYPLIGHNIGLSLGSAGDPDAGYIDQLVCWNRTFAQQWHSDHLSFVRVHDEHGHENNAGVAVPVPYDIEILDLIAARVEAVQAAVPCTFLIENNVSYIDIPEQDMTEPEFLNALALRTGCGLLLDVHNVYVNARNHGFDAAAFVDAIDLRRVVEIHIAGGSELAGMYTDSHSGACPDAVWELLEHVAPRVPHLKAITFEFHDSYFPLLGARGVRQQIDRAREVWQRSCAGAIP